LAGQWLRLSVQALNADQADLAIAAADRALSYRQTEAARLFRNFIAEHQFQALYLSLAQGRLPEASRILARLRVLQGDTETVRRFQALIEYLSLPPDAHISQGQRLVRRRSGKVKKRTFGKIRSRIQAR
jgi:hypothetical protein